MSRNTINLELRKAAGALSDEAKTAHGIAEALSSTEPDLLTQHQRKLRTNHTKAQRHRMVRYWDGYEAGLKRAAALIKEMTMQRNQRRKQ